MTMNPTTPPGILSGTTQLAVASGARPYRWGDVVRFTTHGYNKQMHIIIRNVPVNKCDVVANKMYLFNKCGVVATNKFLIAGVPLENAQHDTRQNEEGN